MVKRHTLLAHDSFPDLPAEVVAASDYDALAARLAELVELLRDNPNAYAYDILETWEGVTAVTVSPMQPDQPGVVNK